LAIVRGKKKKNGSRSDNSFGGNYMSNNYSTQTEYVSDSSSEETQYTIKLSNPNDPRKTWTLPVSGDLLIGRSEHCTVRLDDKSVSREQCKIVVQGAGLAVVHLGSTNKTSLNGNSVVGSSPLQSGDTLKFGRETLRIDYIQSLGTPIPQPQEQQQNQTKGKTESIF
jgi:pSer/pThr/pTyr-binding forkhead associated (FHA) protein